MIEVSDEQFEQLVADAVAAIPPKYKQHLQNLAFMVADQPTREQLGRSGQIHGHTTLLGLYEGIPLPARSAGYSGVVPDLITVFKWPHLSLAHSEAELAANVHETVWHEVAHYFGLNHGQIRAVPE